MLMFFMVARMRETCKIDWSDKEGDKLRYPAM